MKNYLNLFPLFFILLFSCSESTKESAAEKEVETDLKKENLKGDVIMVVDESDWELSFTSYNSDGNRETNFFGSKNNSYFKDDFNYVNKLLTSMSTNKFGEARTEILKYDEKNNLISQELPNYRSIFNFYDNDNKKIKDSTYYYSPKKIEVIKYTYKSDGNRDSTIQHKYESGMTYYLLGKSINSKDFDLFFYIVKENEDKNLIAKYKYLFNGNGDDEKTEIQDVINDTVYITTYKYVYDKHKNWIKSEEFVNNKLYEVVNRKIFYKGDDVSTYILKMNQIINSSREKGTIGSNRVPSPGNSSQSGESIEKGNNSSQSKKCYQCNGSGQCRECSKTFKRNYYKGNGSYDDRNETKPGYVMCNDCWGRGHKQVKRNEGGWEPGGDCHVSGCMDGWIFCRSCNYSGNGRNIGKCERCKGSGKDE
jgi:hypothetical protein